MIDSWYETTVKRTVVETTPERNRHPTGKSTGVTDSALSTIVDTVAVLFPLSPTYSTSRSTHEDSDSKRRQCLSSAKV